MGVKQRRRGKKRSTDRASRPIEVFLATVHTRVECLLHRDGHDWAGRAARTEIWSEGQRAICMICYFEKCLKCRYRVNILACSNCTKMQPQMRKEKSASHHREKGAVSRQWVRSLDRRR